MERTVELLRVLRGVAVVAAAVPAVARGMPAAVQRVALRRATLAVDGGTAAGATAAPPPPPPPPPSHLPRPPSASSSSPLPSGPSSPSSSSSPPPSVSPPSPRPVGAGLATPAPGQAPPGDVTTASRRDGIAHTSLAAVPTQPGGPPRSPAGAPSPPSPALPLLRAPPPSPPSSPPPKSGVAAVASAAATPPPPPPPVAAAVAAAPSSPPLPPPRRRRRTVSAAEFEARTLPTVARERVVPEGALSRVAGFGRLGVGLLAGAVSEATRRTFGMGGGAAGGSTDAAASAAGGERGGGGGSPQGSVLASAANAERLAATLSRMRGAALKVGQMLSIQDADLLPAPLAAALARARAGADVMPRWQLDRTLAAEYGGGDWAAARGVVRFDPSPFAAASIGQVHKAIYAVPAGGAGETGAGAPSTPPAKAASSDEGSSAAPSPPTTPVEYEGWSGVGLAAGGEVPVALKVQYPGVAASIDSDLANVRRLATVSGMAPANLFLDKILAHAGEELRRECDYLGEAARTARFRFLLATEPSLRDDVYVPAVVWPLTTPRVLATEYVAGVPVDALTRPADRQRAGELIFRLTLVELFRWRFMQTDPNFANFLYDAGGATLPVAAKDADNDEAPSDGVLNLIDFGAARAFDHSFVADYLRLIQACAGRDPDAILHWSTALGFLTGDESRKMRDAHIGASLVVGEPFAGPPGETYSFVGNDIAARTAGYGRVMLGERLCPPPVEAYSLHRRLSGAFLIASRLGVTLDAAGLLQQTVQTFDWAGATAAKTERAPTVAVDASPAAAVV